MYGWRRHPKEFLQLRLGRREAVQETVLVNVGQILALAFGVGRLHGGLFQGAWRAGARRR